jgi:hypothetical protein
MAASVKGTAHLYGVSGTQSNCTVLSFREKKHCANKAQTENESGNVIERRRDDITKEATITIRQRSSWSEPDAGDQLTYNSVIYEVEDIEKSESNKGYREVTINLITSEGITLS